MAQNIIPYGRQSISDEDIQAVVEVLKSDYLSQDLHYSINPHRK